uniref:Uncharacterized protein n=1 Tax=Octopus bimaculoides TaxID=37653 RepID=A0A0L8HBJ5_OCTBM
MILNPCCCCCLGQNNPLLCFSHFDPYFIGMYCRISFSLQCRSLKKGHWTDLSY